MEGFYINPFTAMYLCIRDQHRIDMVVLALAFSLVAGVTALFSLRRARQSEGRSQYAWATISGIVLGAGAWSAHNIALLGYLPNAQFSFFVAPVAAALGISLLSGIAAALLLLRLPPFPGMLTASLFYSGGLSAAHYLGMAAIKMPATVRWEPEVVTGSVVLAIMLSVPTFGLLRVARNRIAAGGAVASFGLLVMLTHLSGMLALKIVPGRASEHSLAISASSLAAWIGLVAMALFTLGMLVLLSNHRALAALERSERQLSILVKNTTDYAICTLDPSGRISQWNAGAERLTGYTAVEAIGMPISRLFTVRDCAAGRPAEILHAALEQGHCKDLWTGRRRDGSEFWAEGTIETIFDDHGRHIGFSSITHDVTRICEAQALAAAAARQLDTALENMREGLCLFDTDERIVLCNRRFRELWNLSACDTAPGTPLGRLIAAGFLASKGPGDTAEQLWDFRKTLQEALEEDHISTVVTELGNNRIVSIANSPLPEGGWVTTCTDITALRRTQAQVEHMAFHDPLTGLPNRARYHRRLDHAIERAGTGSDKVAVIAIDLDRFKEINDTYGHAAGDQALRAIAQRLIAAMGDGEVAARLGGDEFAAAKSFHEQAELDEFLERLSDAIVAPVIAEEQSLTVAASLGVALYPRDGADRETLLNNADLALYRTKSSIGHTVCFFEPDMDESARARRQLANDLRHAVSNGELRLLYQPQRSLKTGEISGYEALVRWHHPRRGLIPPVDFIPLAEETGEIFAIGEWVLREACTEARRWPASLKVAVNLSPVQFLQRELVERFRGIMLETGLSPSRLELEVTETAIITDKLRALHCLRQFKAMGVSVAIDDFGTGHSSLETLHAFPFDKIKIDKSFLLRAETSHQALAIIRTVLSLGRSLAIPVLAEGVETAGQVQVLENEGCDEAQGYYFGHPAGAPSVDLNEAVNF